MRHYSLSNHGFYHSCNNIAKSNARELNTIDARASSLDIEWPRASIPRATPPTKYILRSLCTSGPRDKRLLGVARFRLFHIFLVVCEAELL